MTYFLGKVFCQLLENLGHPNCGITKKGAYPVSSVLIISSSLVLLIKQHCIGQDLWELCVANCALFHCTTAIPDNNINI